MAVQPRHINTLSLDPAALCQEAAPLSLLFSFFVPKIIPTLVLFGVVPLNTVFPHQLVQSYFCVIAFHSNPRSSHNDNWKILV